jgi:mgtE-like transporter
LGGSAGGILNSSVETLLTNPSLLTLVPLFSGESGSLISILGARLSSGLHSGLVEPLSKPEGEALHNFVICYILAIIVFPFIGILAEGSSRAFKTMGVGFHKIIPISTLAGLILITVMVFVVYYISTISYNHNLDPDNIVIPISTSVTDSISSLILISVSLLILGALV